jgi:hypothetical protein
VALPDLVGVDRGARHLARHARGMKFGAGGIAVFCKQVAFDLKA